MALLPPARPPEYDSGRGQSNYVIPLQQQRQPPPASAKFDLSPPLIAMMAVLFTALLIVVYVRILSRPIRRLRRRWIRYRRRSRRLALSSTDQEFDFDMDLESVSPAAAAEYYYYYSSGGSSNYIFSPYGLDDSAIKTLPVTIFSSSKGKNVYRDCAVCLFEFEDDDTLRTLPVCSHVFHMNCIDVWLRSHANCPLCRAVVFLRENTSGANFNLSPFVPMRAARIRPSFDDLVFSTPHLALPPPLPPVTDYAEISMDPSISPARQSRVEEDRFETRNFVLERSYSFGFESNLAADRTMLMMDASTPWRYRNRGGTFWSKRFQSPFVSGGGSASARSSRVFSFRSYRGGSIRSPFYRKRSMFSPLSESRAQPGFGFRNPSSRRTRSLTSPVAFFYRPWGGGGSSSTTTTAGPFPPPPPFGSSRTRSGDPEALVSPDRLNRR